ncbi:efflux RND transporter periplasmic adaptor subunit [Cellulomonas gilvus]|uniref:Efflux transporter, RND family, MFP subunit n=1 Tax=Cellulomonas gilvus (strain ATCC 13127 / NRRL B-14078) TaxID=593907 RepID=F8A3A1_CELGA|nr:biotin/lipoyl-binding protein [Cellulomonas gilvus]AEI13094.1 efflux transporter, RND family, MFP subunit [Cellulomonas gilvus ATCC 13127]
MRTHGRRRWFLRGGAAVVVLALLAGGAWWIWWREPAEAATAAPTTQTVQASLTTMEKSVTGTGTLTPTVNENVAFAVSGTVTAVDVAVGDTVTAGQRLATVDTLELDAALLSANATLVEAQARLADAQDADDGTDVAQAQVDAAAAQVDVAQAAYDAAQDALADARLTAPAAGLVTAVDVAVGDVVSGSSGSGGGAGEAGAGTGGTGGAGTGTSSTATSSAQFTIVGTQAWQVTTTVDETDVALLEVGDQVEMTSDDLTGTLYGTVAEIGLVSSSTSGVASYPVTVDVIQPEETLHDGVSVDVEVIYERRTDVLTVPALAVTQADDGTSQVTTLAADGSESTVTVETGETSGSMIEITSGLAEGDSVVLQVFTRGGTGGGTGTQDQQGRLPAFDGGQMPQMPEGFVGGPGGQGNG